jgi:hypothetical protein
MELLAPKKKLDRRPYLPHHVTVFLKELSLPEVETGSLGKRARKSRGG